MQIHIDRSSFLPPYRQIKDQIKDLISNGELKENQLFGSVRKVAEMAGVSVATVQKTLNELKQENLVYSKPGDGYYVAKQVAISDTVFIILPSSRLSFYTYILEGMYEANQNIGLSLQVFSLKTDKLAWDTHTIELLKTARRDKCSVIFIEEAWDQVREECLRTAKKVPFLTIEWVLENAINIVNDYKIAGHYMIEYLLKKRNAKGILVLKGRVNQYNASERLVGMQDAAREFGLKEGKQIEYYASDFDAISAYEVVKQHFSSQKFDAVICANDYEAMGAIGAFLEKRVLVGKEVALIGFGNMIDNVTSYIPLTTMDQRLKLIGIKAIQSINELRKGIEVKGTTITIPTKLIERKT